MKERFHFVSTLRACASLFRIKLAEGLQYRVAGLAGATTSLFWCLIEITVYSVFYTYAANREAGPLSGLDLQQVITYCWLAQFLFIMQPMNLDSEILNKINNGDVGIELCRPLDLYSHWFAKIAATRITPLLWRGIPMLAVGVIMPGTYGMGHPASLAGLIAALVSVFGAFLLCTSFGMLICSIRLNVSWGNGPAYMILLVGSILSGAYLPLQLWPDSMQRFLLIQPFAGYLDIPVRLYIGTLSPSGAFGSIGLQILWSLFFILTGKQLMAVRLKNIVVQGG